MSEAGSSSGVPNVGEVVDHVPVTIGPKFLELFSKQLYSSPNKAFEELVSNSWDAGAETVYIRIPQDLSDKAADIWVLDDGESMDLAGLHSLWEVATSPKRGESSVGGRVPIGKFGIGKLSTYLLANELTYICKARDGVIRAVTMNYGVIDEGPANELHSEAGVNLPVRRLSDEDLRKLLKTYKSAGEILDLIKNKIPKPEDEDNWDDEFGGEDPPIPPKKDTWTLALLTALKTPGKEVQAGRIGWLLRTALPLGSSISIDLNGDTLPPSKVDIELDQEWVIGEQLDISSLDLPNGETVSVERFGDHVRVEGIGKISGRVRLYKDRISGGKSDLVGRSNGFFVNIRGRVINPQDPYFGLENLNHRAWSKFRATVRADEIDEQLSVDREGLLEGSKLMTLKSLLRAMFNKARAYDQASQPEMPDIGEILAKSWGVMPLQSLHQIVSDSLSNGTEMPDFIDSSGVSDKDKVSTLQTWNEIAEQDPGELIAKVDFDNLSPDAQFVKYDLAGRRLVVNSSHPFFREHNETSEQQRLLRDTALIDFLTEAYMVDIGIDRELISEAWDYRDRALRLVTQLHRKSGAQIAQILLDTTRYWKGLEIILGDALESLGFDVERLATPGEPEGVATAPTTPRADDTPNNYVFTYDAKASAKTSAKAFGKGKAKTKDIATAGLARHRKKHGADHVLVVAPDYEMGALQEECEMLSITPMRVEDLAALVMLVVATGPPDLTEFRSVFDLRDPDQVHEWVEEFSRKSKEVPRVSLDVFLSALVGIGYTGPNAITTSVVADRISQLPGIDVYPKRKQIRDLVSGLEVLVPSLV